MSQRVQTIILSTNRHLKITPIQIVLFHQARPRTNNLDKLKTPTSHHTTNKYQSPPQNPINPHKKPANLNTYKLIITENSKRHTHKLLNPPQKFQSGSTEKTLESVAKKNSKSWWLQTRKTGTGRRRPRKGWILDAGVAGPDGRVLHHRLGVL